MAELARIESRYHAPDGGVDEGGVPLKRRRPAVDADVPRDIVTTFNDVYVYRDRFLEGRIPLLVIVGGKGLSKTFCFEQALADDLEAEFRHWEAEQARPKERPDQRDDEDSPTAGDQGDQPQPPLEVRAKVIKSVASPVGVYEALYRYRDKLIVIDDVDAALKKPELVSMLKAVCNRKRAGEDGRPVPNLVEWRKQNRELEKKGVPRSFYTTSHVCVIGNKLLGIDQDLDAMLSRGMFVEFDPSVEEVHRFVGGWWDGRRHKDVYGWVGERLQLVPTPSIRWYTLAVDYKLAGFDWKERLTKMWSVLEPFMGDFVRAWHDPTLTDDDHRYRAFARLNGRSKSDYDRLKRRYKAIHGINGRRRGR